jgi:ribosomal protein S11
MRPIVRLAATAVTLVFALTNCAGDSLRVNPAQTQRGDSVARANAPAVDVKKAITKATKAVVRKPADLTGAQFATNCGNATVAPIFDAAKMGNGTYGENYLVAVSDPDIVLIGNQWWMIFASGPAIPRALAPVAAYLPPGASLATTTTYPSDPNGWHLVGANPSGTGTVPPISSSASSWDAVAAETPSATVGANGQPLIYYSGHNTGQTNFEIGLIEGFNTSTGTAPITLSNPVMVAQQPWEFSSGLGAILEQSIRWEPQLNEYLMYYTAGAWWASPPDNTLAQATSTDGINWVNRTKMDFPVAYYNQDFTYNANRSRYEMVISKDPTGAGGANPRNLVWREAATPATTMANWVNETTLLQYNAPNAQTFYNSGILSPAIHYGNLPGETNRLYVFFHSYSQAGDMTIGRFYCDPIGVPATSAQTITFYDVPAQTVGTTLTLSATASSGLPVTYSIVQNGTCTISGNVVSFVQAGNCGVVANQAGNSTYSAAPAVGQVITVNNPLIAQTINFGAIPAQPLGTSLTVSATASSGLPVSFSVVPNGNCSISGSVVTFLQVGNCGVVANQAGNNTYAAAPAVGQVIVVNNASSTPAPTPTPTPVKTPTPTPVPTPTPTPVPTPTPTPVPTPTPTPVPTPTPTPAPKSQTISFGAIPAQYVSTSLTVSASATSGLPVSFSVVPNGNCSISGSVVSFLNAGNCGVVATQAGNGTYAAAPAVGQIIVVNNLPSKPIAQTISFSPLPAGPVGTKVTVSATASSGLPVSFSLVPNGNCSISGNVVTLLNVGNCGVVANQAGNAAYAAAPAVGQIIVVN